jgi:hypothetical protein
VHTLDVNRLMAVACCRVYYVLVRGPPVPEREPPPQDLGLEHLEPMPRYRYEIRTILRGGRRKTWKLWGEGVREWCRGYKCSERVVSKCDRVFDMSNSSRDGVDVGLRSTGATAMHVSG